MTENRWTNRWIEGQLTQAYPFRMAIWGCYNESVAILCLPVQRFAQDQKPWPGEKRWRHGGSFSLNHHQNTTHSHHSIQSICSFCETFPLTLLPAEPEAFRVPKSNRSHVVINNTHTKTRRREGDRNSCIKVCIQTLWMWTFQQMIESQLRQVSIGPKSQLCQCKQIIFFLLMQNHSFFCLYVVYKWEFM